MITVLVRRIYYLRRTRQCSMKCRMKREGKAVGRETTYLGSWSGGPSRGRCSTPWRKQRGFSPSQPRSSKENSRVCSDGRGDEPRHGEKTTHGPVKPTLELSCIGSWPETDCTQLKLDPVHIGLHYGSGQIRALSS